MNDPQTPRQRSEGGGHKTGLTNRLCHHTGIPEGIPAKARHRGVQRQSKRPHQTRPFADNIEQVVKPGPLFLRDPQRIAVEKNEVNDYCQIGMAITAHQTPEV